MKFRVLHLSATPWFRTVEADSALGAAEWIVQHPIRDAEVWHHQFEGQRATTWVMHEGWVTVIHPEREAVT